MDDGQVVSRLRVTIFPDSHLGPRYNIAPTQEIPIAVERYDDGMHEIRCARWGLVPQWSRTAEAGAGLINARAETVTAKPSFRAAAARRRCLVPASGYYEWMRTPSGKQPYYLHDDDSLLAFAGLYEEWWPADADRSQAEPIVTATIITRAAPDALGMIHDRTPVILPEEMWADWLAPAITDRADVAGILASVPEPRLTPRRVGPAVGNVRNDGPALIAPAPDPATPARPAPRRYASARQPALFEPDEG